MKVADLEVTRFKGLNTVRDPLSLGLGWMTQADNVNVNAAGKLERRVGFEAAALAGTAISASYNTLDFERAYIVDAGVLKSMDGVTLATGLSTDPASWTEANNSVYMVNGTDAVIIRPDDSVLAWSWPVPPAPDLRAVSGNRAAGLYRACCTYILPDGRETGPGPMVELELAEGEALQLSGITQTAGYTTRTYIAPANSAVFGLARRDAQTAFVWDYPPESLGIELRTDGCDAIPAGADVVQFWRGRMWAALYDQTSNTTTIFPSKALGFHLFDLDEGETVEGRVIMLAPTPNALLIATDRYVWARTAEGQLDQLASYGVVPGVPWCFDITEDGSPGDNTVLFWSTRGLCRAMPFANLTARHLSVAPGVQAGAAILARNGEKHFIANLHAGGTAFNTRSTS